MSVHGVDHGRGALASSCVECFRETAHDVLDKCLESGTVSVNFYTPGNVKLTAMWSPPGMVLEPEMRLSVVGGNELRFQKKDSE